MKAKEKCATCFYFGKSVGSCDYIFVVDQMRPCAPGEACTEHITKKEREKQMRKLQWNTEEGRQMWLDGKKDSQIADAFGVSAATVASYRKKHWEGLYPKGVVREMRKAAAQQETAGQTLPAEEATVAAVPVQEAPAEPKEPEQTVIKPEQTAVNPEQNGEPVPVAAQIGVMEVIEQATANLTGIQAVCTAQAIQALWNWRTPEDLQTAQRSIQYLLRRMS